MNKARVAVFWLVTLSFVIALYFYPLMPERMASHWNAQGAVNGYMPKALGLLLMPVLTLGLALLFAIIPKIDPLGRNIETFRGYYDWFVAGIMGFLLYVYALTLVWNLGYGFDMGTFLLPALGLLFYGVGVLFGKAKQNWFIGIRTPWTLGSPKVWDRTHRQGALLFKIVGILTIILPVLGLNVLAVLFLIILIVIYLTVFSYLEYKKEVKAA